MCEVRFYCYFRNTCQHNPNRPGTCPHISAGSDGAVCHSQLAQLDALERGVINITKNPAGLPELAAAVKTLLRTKRIDYNHIVEELGVSKAIISRSVNFIVEDGKLTGSRRVWLWLENEFGIRILSKLKKWGWR